MKAILGGLRLVSQPGYSMAGVSHGHACMLYI